MKNSARDALKQIKNECDVTLFHTRPGGFGLSKESILNSIVIIRRIASSALRKKQ
jgi:hypothetical protein